MLFNKLVMRLRKGGPTRTQWGLPKAVRNSLFFDGCDSIFSSHDGSEHRIISTSGVNHHTLYKVCCPVIKAMIDPVAEFERKEDRVVYRVYERDGWGGIDIDKKLNEGLRKGETVVCTPNVISRSTMYRFLTEVA